jgi:hypothetical protein
MASKSKATCGPTCTLKLEIGLLAIFTMRWPGHEPQGGSFKGLSERAFQLTPWLGWGQLRRQGYHLKA